MVQVEELHLDAIYSNVVAKAKDVLEEYEKENQKTIKVEIVREHTDIGSHFKISMYNNGPGIPPRTTR